MGFFKNCWKAIKDGAKELASDIKDVAKELGSDIGKGISSVGTKLQKAGDWITNTIKDLGKKQAGPTIETNWTSSGSSSSSGSSTHNSINEEELKRQREQENEVITKYQQQIEERAESREKDVKKAYKKIYSDYIEAFEEVFDSDIIDSIKDYVKIKSQSFANTLRDEVNTKVNSSYLPWQQLISKKPTPKQLQNYCDQVYTDADNNLLDSLQTAIEETNKFMSRCINKYNDDRANALSEMKKSLINLTADEETKAQELKKIAEELVVAQFISNEAYTKV